MRLGKCWALPTVLYPQPSYGSKERLFHSWETKAKVSVVTSEETSPAKLISRRWIWNADWLIRGRSHNNEILEGFWGVCARLTSGVRPHLVVLIGALGCLGRKSQVQQLCYRLLCLDKARANATIIIWVWGTLNQKHINLKVDILNAEINWIQMSHGNPWRHHEVWDGANLEQSDPALMVDLLQGSQWSLRSFPA